MTPTLTKLLLILLWAAVGAVGAWLSFLLLQKQAGSILPDGEAPLSQLPKMMAGRTLRLIIVGVALYIAVRMNSLYALVFVIALTLTTWLLIRNLNQKTGTHKDDHS